ncbi:MAG: TATA-box-binding protein [Promethearchaeota archaeon]
MKSLERLQLDVFVSIYKLMMENISLEEKFTYTIQNVVATVATEIEKTIDLTTIASAYPDVEYNPDRFPGLVMRVLKPKATSLIFSTGKMVITGMKSPTEAHSVVNQIIARVKKCKINVKKPIITIQNFVVSGDIKCGIDLNKATVVMDNVMYEPEVFPGLIFRMKDPKSVLLLFSTGKIVCTGVKDEETVIKVFEKLYRVVREYGVDMDPSKFEEFNEEEEKMSFL